MSPEAAEPRPFQVDGDLPASRVSWSHEWQRQRPVFLGICHVGEAELGSRRASTASPKLAVGSPTNLRGTCQWHGAG